MVLESIKAVVPLLRLVRVDEERIAQVVEDLGPEDLGSPTWREEVFPEQDDRVAAEFMLVANAINFSYWGEPKWTVSYRGRAFDGAFGLFAALSRALEEGRPVTDGSYLANLSEEELACVLRGNVRIPMFGERLQILREVGDRLVREYGGRPANVIRVARNSAPELVKILVGTFSSFDDTAELDGCRVKFHKRAQLAAAMLCQRFGGNGWGALEGLERLTVYADYKLPQALRRLGILRYSEDLGAKVDGQTELPAGSREEVEIRIATVWAGELLRRRLAMRFDRINATHVDYYLWSQGQRRCSADRPYHRTRTIYY